MKKIRLICLLLAVLLCLSLCACKTEELADPKDTERPTQTTAPSERETDPPESTAPTQTEPVPSTEETLSWKQVYSTLLSELRGRASIEGYSYTDDFSIYSLYDLDGDNIPELFAKLGTCEADYMYHVYTARADGVLKLGILGGSHSGLCGLWGQNACLRHGGHMGYEQITKITLKNGTLSEETVYESSSGDYHDLSYLPSYALDQHEGLNWEGNPYDDNQAVLDNLGGVPYLLSIPFADQSVYSGPSYDHSFVQTVEQAGTYTIVEEQWDYEGNLWGKLKSGVGWVDLTDIEYRSSAKLPISANYADRPLLNSGNYLYYYDAEGGAAYGFSVAFRSYEKLSNVRLHRANLAADSGLELTELYSFPQLTPEQPLVADVNFPGDMSAYAITFTDSKGVNRTFILTTSGRNNALIFYEY